MSHFFVLAFIEPDVVEQGAGDILNQVSRVMTLFTTNLMRTDNSHVYWDSWQIGGRYDGVISRGSSRDKADNHPAAIESETLANNMCPVRDLSEDLVPFAVVTSAGQSFIEGTMGAFGYSHDHDPYWEDKYDTLREKYVDCVAVGLDCHN